MVPFPFQTPSSSENILLIGGAGDGDTGGGLCAFDGTNLRLIDRVSTAGLTLFDGRLARLLRAPITTGGGEILVYDRRGVSHYFRVDELSDAHYMAWDGQHLIVASTGNNSLYWITLGGEVTRRWRAPGGDDSWHLNDVCLVDQRVYACAFGRYAHYRDYKAHLHSGDGFIFDVDSGSVAASGFCAPHSPRYFDDAWTVCDSLRESVVQVEPGGGERRQAKLRSFTRGLAVTDDYLIVGESAQRRGENLADTGSIAILRRSDFSFVARFELPFREVAEIAVVPRALLDAVETGFRTNPLRVGESDQLQMFRDIGLEPKRLWAVSERLAPSHCRVRIEAKVPPRLLAGNLSLVECTIRNLGESFLCSELTYPVRLSYRWQSVSGGLDRGDGIRTSLPCILRPGSSIACRMEVRAPEAAGEYQLCITLVQEFVAWFNELDPANGCSARVNVVLPEANGTLQAEAGGYQLAPSR